MIRSAEQLRARLEGGATVSRLAMWGDVKGFRLADTETGETVHGAALASLERKGEAQPIATDICGDPMQWGLAANGN